MPKHDSESITIRDCTAIEEYRQCVALQRTVWGWDDEDLIPTRFFVVARKIEGQVIGAFEPLGRMVGFCLAVPALRGSLRGSMSGSVIYLHSHMLAVLEEYRRTGLGRRMKLEQRRQALARGIKLIEWTFDPLEWKNAIFNLNRLGAVARRYVVNQYGTSSSPLHRGLPTDRLIAEWWLDSPRVTACVDGPVAPDIAPAMATDIEPAREPRQRITVPLDTLGSAETHSRSTADIQSYLRTEFQHAFSIGLAATSFVTAGSDGHYLLTPYPDSK